MDNINQPQHYGKDIQCIEAMAETCDTKRELIEFCRLTAFRYLWRANHKEDYFQDIAKANWYLSFALEYLSVDTIDEALHNINNRFFNQSPNYSNQSLYKVTLDQGNGSKINIEKIYDNNIKEGSTLRSNLDTGVCFVYYCWTKNSAEALKRATKAWQEQFPPFSFDYCKKPNSDGGQNQS